MSTPETPLNTTAAVHRTEEMKRELRKLGRHDWSLWALALVVILSLTGAVTTLSLSVLNSESDPFYEFHISQSVRGLVGLVLVFSVYTLFQQVQLRRTRGRLAEQIDISSQEHVRADEFLKLAMVDSLTGLHNRRFGEERLAAEISRAKRNGTSLTMLMLDLDDFKLLNDRYGHPAGDAALKKIAERLTSAIRGSDLAVRIGGDEFVVLLPDCLLGQVQRVLDRLTPLEIEIDAVKVSFSFSAGWTNYRQDETPEQLFHRADHALYAQKQIRKSQPLLAAKLPENPAVPVS